MPNVIHDMREVIHWVNWLDVRWGFRQGFRDQGNTGIGVNMGASVNNGSPTGASYFGGFKYDFINLPEGNLSIIGKILDTFGKLEYFGLWQIVDSFIIAGLDFTV